MATARPAGAAPLFAAFAIGLSAAFQLAGYEFVRSSANTLFKQAYGSEGLPYVMALVPFAMLAMLYGYGRLLSWLGPRRTLFATALLSSGAILACYAAIQAGWAPARGALYLVREAYIVLLIEQYWSFLNSRLGDSAARKLNGPICGLGSLGAVLGAAAVEAYSKDLGTLSMPLFGALAILPAAFCSEWAYARCGEPSPAEDRAAPEHSDALGLKLFARHRMLLLLLVVILATQVISTMLDLAFQSELQKAIPEADAQNAWSGGYFKWLNVAAAFSQFVLCPLLLYFLPLWFIHLLLPLGNLAACGFLAMHESLGAAGAAYMTFKVLDYSLFRAAKEVLYIPFPFDVRYRAKELIDAWGYRFGKGGASIAVALLKGVRGAGAVLSVTLLAAVGAASAVVWLFFIVAACRAAAPAPPTPDPAARA
jgi:ATP:ADP antiporter, AAA family